jgi:Helix-hairpin-helix domain
MHGLTEHPLPGVDPEGVRRLTDAGYVSIEDLASASPHTLADRTGFDLKSCRALVRVAKAVLSRPQPPEGVIALAPPRDEPASVRLTRGLTAARNVERAVSSVRKAKAHAGKRPRKASWAAVHSKARRQLRRLLERLQELQQNVLSEGLSAASNEHLATELEGLERELAAIVEAPVRKQALKRLRRAARRVRRALA